MNDTVTKLMALADTYAGSPFIEGSDSDKRYKKVSRQALQDELTKTFSQADQDLSVAGLAIHDAEHGITGGDHETA